MLRWQRLYLAASISVSKMPSSRLMLFILMAALHLAPALVTPLNCDVFVLFRFLICKVRLNISFL